MKGKMKRKKDVGLAYIQRIGIRTPGSVDELTREMILHCGEKRTGTFLQGLQQRTGREFYDYKDRDPELARLFTGAQDADIIRKSANWVHQHRSAFGQEILEVGCDLGFFTGFLALEFPAAHITSVDHSACAIRATRALLDDLGVTNVTLVHAGLDDFPAGDAPSGGSFSEAGGERTFDTIVSMRALQENCSDLEDPGCQLLDYLLDRYYLPLGCTYADSLSRAIRPGGTLISIMESELTPAFAAWMMNLQAIGWSIDYSSCTRISCRQPNQENTPLQIFTACAEEKLLPGAVDPLRGLPGSPYLSQELLDRVEEAKYFWIELLGIPQNLPVVLYGLQAEVICSELSQKLITGVGFYGPQGQEGKFALYTLQDSDESFALYQQLDGQISLTFINAKGLADCKKKLYLIETGKDPDLSADLKRHGLHPLRITADETTRFEQPVLSPQRTKKLLQALRDRKE